METPARLQATEPDRKVDQAFGDQMHYLPGSLQLAVDAKQHGAEQFAALLGDEPGLDDDVGPAAFVFQRDEDDAGTG